MAGPSCCGTPAAAGGAQVCSATVAPGSPSIQKPIDPPFNHEPLTPSAKDENITRCLLYTAMLLSTNPIAVAVPAFEEPAVVLDMATTVAAYGKVKTAAQRGQDMPVGWMVTKEGEPLVDPKRADEGFLLPIGGPKGSGLSLVFGLLAGVLNGAAFGRDVVDFNADFQTATNTGQFIVAIDIAAFGDANDFKRRVDVGIREIKSSPTMPGFDEVLLPGENSFRKRRDNEANGIPIADTLQEGLNDLAENLGIRRLSA